MGNKINTFIEPIFDKRKNFDIKSYIKKRKLIKKIKKISPNFDMLMEIYNFLLILEDVYMYSNSDEHYLFISTAPYSFIYKEDNFTIKFALNPSKKTISMNIERKMRTKKDSEIIPPFKDGEYQISNKYEEEKFAFIIACLMNGVVELIEYYYKNKRF